MSDTAAWLNALGLSEYAAVFADNAIELAHLPGLDHDSLKELGVRPLGHRMTILGAARTLRAGPPSVSTGADGDVRTSAPPRVEAERRQLTVMFCDMVRSVELGERMELEDYRELLAAFREAVVSVVRRNGGFIARHQGDGLLVYFGYPQAHENDAERAVRTGLDIIREIARLDQSTAVDVSVRIGVATGRVVVGDVLATASSSSSEYAAFGSTPNLAARLQGQAEPDTMLVSSTTHLLVGSAFEWKPARELSLRGMEGTIRAYQIVAERGNKRRGDALAGGDSAPFVGREQELAMLRERWNRARQGDGQVVVVEGAAGVGKSRLLQALETAVATEARAVLPYQCSAFHENSTLFPLIDRLNQQAKIELEDPPARRRRKLRALSKEHVAAGRPYASAVDILIDQACSTRDNEYHLTPQFEPRLDVLVEILCDFTRKGPLLVVIEDIQWADPSTMTLVKQVIEAVATLPALVLITHRADYEPQFRQPAHLSRLPLPAFSVQESEALVRMTATVELTPEVIHEICERSDGIPLFLEEITYAVEQGQTNKIETDDAGAEAHSEVTIPERLQDALMARLDRLGDAKHVAQIGAVIGRRFEHGMLEAVARGSGQQLADCLNTLTASDVVTVVGTPPRCAYVFSHALVQEAAYLSLLRAARSTLHARCAAALVESFPNEALTRPDRVAYHYTRAAMADEAIGYWTVAGRRALARSAGTESCQSVEQGIELLASLPEGTRRDTLELALRVIQGSALLMTHGQGTPEVERAYARALELARRSGDDAELFPALLGMWRYYIANAALPSAQQMAERLLDVSEAVGGPVHTIVARMTLANTSFHLGDFTDALAHSRAGLAAYDPQQRSSQDARLFLIGQDPVVSLEFCGAFSSWLLSDRSLAGTHAERGLTLARTLDQPYSLGMALVWTCILSQLHGDLERTRRVAAELLSLSQDHHLPWCHGIGLATDGWVRVQAGEGESGAETIRQGLRILRQTRVSTFTIYSDGLLADAYRALGQPEAGLAALARALESMERTGARWDAPRLLRLKGQLELMVGDRPLAEASLRDSIASARSMSMVEYEACASALLHGLLAENAQGAQGGEQAEPGAASGDGAVTTRSRGLR